MSSSVLSGFKTRGEAKWFFLNDFVFLNDFENFLLNLLNLILILKFYFFRLLLYFLYELLMSF